MDIIYKWNGQFWRTTPEGPVVIQHKDAIKAIQDGQAIYEKHHEHKA